jgi:hypothetical protein
VVVREGEVLFGKNSDRDPNEAQRVEWHPRRAHAAGSLLRCTWTTIPEVRETHAVVLSRPYWMWGAEMGANEHGVVVGNEAVFTRGARRDERGLLGMDLVRLALERAASAEEAVSVLRALVAEHGQSGRSGYDDPGFWYDSSFLVADARGAWVVETAGREVATERVTSGARAISNGLTIEAFARRYADPLKGRVAECRARRGRVESLAAGARGPRDIAGTLRDHGALGLRYRLLNGSMASPCMHAGGLVASSQTVASWISRLTPGGAEHFVTATAAPCLSGFKPIDLGSPLDLGAPTGVDDGESHFWKLERLHRAVVGDPERSAQVQRERDAWEEATWRGGRDPEEAFRSFDALVTASLESAAGARDLRPLHARWYWQRRHQDARAGAPKLPAR